MASPYNSLVILFKNLRKLAKSNRYQTIYNQYKETGVSLFKNKFDYTEAQISFLQYLSFYVSLNMDIYMNEVSDIVLDNEIFEDAYSYYKSKTKKQLNKERDKQLKLPSKNKTKASQSPTVNKTHIIFSKPRIKG